MPSAGRTSALPIDLPAAPNMAFSVPSDGTITTITGQVSTGVDIQ
jgi:hypothetical protein